MRKNLKEARQKAGMTQQQMADRLGLNLRHYQKIEYGEIGGSFEIWDALEDNFSAFIFLIMSKRYTYSVGSFLLSDTIENSCST